MKKSSIYGIVERNHIWFISLCLFLLIFFSSLWLLTAQENVATVDTDKADYASGDMVMITGSGWQPGESVALEIHGDPVIAPDLPPDTLYAVADEEGNITNEYIVPGYDVVQTFTVTATGESSGLTAQTAFTNSLDSSPLPPVETTTAESATVITDKSDYVPGETVIITGAGWLPGETVALELVETPLIHPAETLYAVANDTGNIENTEYVIQNHDLGQTFTLTATGLTSGLAAQTTFTDGSTITSVTLNGVSSVTVLAGATISAVVDVTTNNPDTGADTWGSTLWLISTTPPVPPPLHCENHGNHGSSGVTGSFSETFNITAPATVGTYNAYFRTGSNDTCAGTTSALFTMTNSVVVTNCGNGAIDAGETCDDGNMTNGDGCSSTCSTEAGYSCPTPGQPCTPICGDGLIKGAETCDDGNTANGDCCSSTCQLDPDDTPCLDGNACNGAEACQAGVCTAGEPLTCDNGLFCDGTETCDPSTGCEDGPDPSTDDGVSCTTDACDESSDMITHTPVDAVCDDGQFCTGTETCDANLGCQDGVDPSTDDGVSCTTDACDEGADMVTHTPVDSVCDDGLFCTGTETCDATLGCQDGTPPETDDGFGCTDDSCDEDADKVVHDPNDDFCSDDILCTADVCDPEAEGADETSGCTNQFDEEVCFASISSSSLCLFDVDTNADGCQFRLIFTPDQNSPSAWKQNASNPGQYYYNTFYVGDGGETINITVPYPFVTQGAVPIHIYDSVGGVPSGDTGCYLPGTEIGHSSAQIMIGDYSGAGDTVTIPVEIPHVEDGYAYINIHLDYGLKGTNNYSKNALNDAIDATSFAIRIPNLNGYNFDDDSLTAGDTCQNTNVFKRDPGIGGLVLESDGDPVANVKVQIYQGTKLMATVYTDADGWYMWQYKYTGKATTFTVKLPDYSLSKSVTLKSNGYIVVSFTLP